MINRRALFVGDMLLMAHLFTGVVIGLVLLMLTGQKWTVLAAAVGAVYPDLVDKPLGHLLLSSELDNGRIFCHTRLFLGVCFLIAYILYRYKGSWVGIAFALGVLSHQYLDLMFFTPTSWLWPALGAFEHGFYPNYFSWGVTTELSTPYEYLFFLLSAVTIAYVYGQKLMGIPDLVLVQNRRLVYGLLLATAVLLLMAGTVLLLSSPTYENVDYLFAGGLCLAGGFVFKNLKPIALPRRDRSAPPGR